MNWIDWAIVVTFSLLTLLGLKGGLLASATGLGGVILGFALATKFHADLAGVLGGLIAGDTVRNAGAFIAIVVVTTVITRVAARAAKGVLSTLMRGWADRLAGGLAGAGVATVILGTGLYMLGTVGLPQLNDSIEASTFGSSISHMSLFSASDADCSEQPGEDADGCSGLATQARGGLGGKIAGRLAGALGLEPNLLEAALQSGLTGSIDEIPEMTLEELAPQVEPAE
jgi:uncharacterized membrane protein required for colicin V production